MPLAALLLGLAYLVLDPPRHAVLATRPARSDVAEFGARISSVAPSGPCCSAARARPRGSMSAPLERRAQAPRQCGLEDYLKFKYLPSRASVGYPGSDCRLTGNEFRRVDDRCGSEVPIGAHGQRTFVRQQHADAPAMSAGWRQLG